VSCAGSAPGGKKENKRGEKKNGGRGQVEPGVICPTVM
jgi:hypothetical protein